MLFPRLLIFLCHLLHPRLLHLRLLHLHCPNPRLHLLHHSHLHPCPLRLHRLNLLLLLHHIHRCLLDPCLPLHRCLGGMIILHIPVLLQISHRFVLVPSFHYPPPFTLQGPQGVFETLPLILTQTVFRLHWHFRRSHLLLVQLMIDLSGSHLTVTTFLWHRLHPSTSRLLHLVNRRHPLLLLLLLHHQSGVRAESGVCRIDMVFQPRQALTLIVRRIQKLCPGRTRRLGVRQCSRNSILSCSMGWVNWLIPP